MIIINTLEQDPPFTPEETEALSHRARGVENPKKSPGKEVVFESLAPELKSVCFDDQNLNYKEHCYPKGTPRNYRHMVLRDWRRHLRAIPVSLTASLLQ